MERWLTTWELWCQTMTQLQFFFFLMTVLSGSNRSHYTKQIGFPPLCMLSILQCAGLSPGLSVCPTRDRHTPVIVSALLSPRLASPLCLQLLWDRPAQAKASAIHYYKEQKPKQWTTPSRPTHPSSHLTPTSPFTVLSDWLTDWLTDWHTNGQFKAFTCLLLKINMPSNIQRHIS